MTQDEVRKVIRDRMDRALRYSVAYHKEEQGLGYARVLPEAGDANPCVFQHLVKDGPNVYPARKVGVSGKQAFVRFNGCSHILLLSELVLLGWDPFPEQTQLELFQ